MHIKKLVVPVVAVSVFALGVGVGPAQADPGKQEQASVSGNAADAKAQSTEAAAVRANRVAQAKGGLGAYYDEASDEQVLVMSNSSKLSADEASKAVGANARVERRALTKATADAVTARIVSRSFAVNAAAYGYGSYTDLQTGKVVVTTSAPASVTDELVREFGDAIDLRADVVQDAFTRRTDVAPFWGGSSIKSGGRVCTSSFVVWKSGLKRLLTAGHCFPLGANVLTTDGNISVGTVVQRGPIPPFDMEMIGGKSYGRSIFVGGTTSSTGKPVNGAGDPAVGLSGYCFSGQTSGERCGQVVRSVTATVCTQTGCKSPVIAFNTGAGIQPGDSGAPFYRPNSTGVGIRGLCIASGGGLSYAEKWSRISSHLGVTIATS